MLWTRLLSNLTLASSITWKASLELATSEEAQLLGITQARPDQDTRADNMAHRALVFAEMGWNEGEKQMHGLMHVPQDIDNPTVPQLSQGAAILLERSPLLSTGTVDSAGNIWCSVWGGEAGFARGLPQSHIAMKVPVDRQYDPVVQALTEGRAVEADGMVEEVKGKMLAGLAIDLEHRRRVKLFGRAVAGALSDMVLQQHTDSPESSAPHLQLIVNIEQSLGNCPKYLNSKHVVPAVPNPQLVSDSDQLDNDAQRLIEKSDLFFVASANKDQDMDVNHRGGPAGFLRVVPGSASKPAKLVWPEYSGNRLYQTLGNLIAHPHCGMVIPDFETGDVVYITGQTEVLVGPKAAALITRSNLAVAVTVKRAIFIRRGLSFTARSLEPSPYNPRLRFLAGEAAAKVAGTSQDGRPARMVNKRQITEDVAAFTFELEDVPSNDAVAQQHAAPRPGQWVALDLSDSLYDGYSHMRDEDPTSLNDDFVRTFTVSSYHDPTVSPHRSFVITIRKVGRVTGYLFDPRRLSQVRVQVLGFGGDFHITQKQNETGSVGFIAGGIGITPLLPAVQSLDLSRFHLIWTLGSKDLPLVADVLHEHPQLAERTQLFVTGGTGSDADLAAKQIEALGVSRIERRRLNKSDLDSVHEINTWYTCTSPSLRKALLAWLPDKELVYEDFSY